MGCAKQLFIIAGEIDPGHQDTKGVIIGKKGQYLQSITFQASEDCIVKIYDGEIKKKTISEEVIDRLAGRQSFRSLALLSELKARETFMIPWDKALPITVTVSFGKLKYTTEVVE